METIPLLRPTKNTVKIRAMMRCQRGSYLQRERRGVRSVVRMCGVINRRRRVLRPPAPFGKARKAGDRPVRLTTVR